MKIIPLILFLSLPLLSMAQPNKGFKAGTNITWFNTNNTISDYSPALGYHFGYTWHIKCSPKVSITIESLFNHKSTKMKHLGINWNLWPEINTEQWIKKRIDAYYISAPLGINYILSQRFYLSSGYEFSYCLHELFGSSLGPTYDHAGYFGTGFHSRYFDFIVRYTHTFNQDKTGIGYYSPNSISTHKSGKSQSLQFSIILSLGKKNKKE